MSLDKQEELIEKEMIKSCFSTSIDIIGSAILGPIWSIKELVKCSYSSAKQIAFNNFLFGIYKKAQKEKLSEKDIEKFSKKLDKQEYFNYISNIIDSMFFSKCKIARNILGWITMKYLIEDKLDYEDLVLVNGLKDVFDFELEEFVKFAQEPDNGPKQEIGSGLVFVSDYNDNARIFITKLINLGIFGNDLAGNRLIGDGQFPLKYVKTSVTKRLLEYVMLFNKITEK